MAFVYFNQYKMQITNGDHGRAKTSIFSVLEGQVLGSPPTVPQRVDRGVIGVARLIYAFFIRVSLISRRFRNCLVAWQFEFDGNTGRLVTAVAE